MPTKPVAFGEWLPDRPKFGNPGALEAKNVVPSEGAYRPLLELEGVANTHTGETAKGAFAAFDDARTLDLFVGGTKSLYRRVGSSFSDVSTTSFTYSCSAGDQWDFAVYGGSALAANIGDPIQRISLSSGTAFVSLANAPNARFLTRIKDFLVAGNTRETGSDFPKRVRWCADDNITDWTPSQTTQSGVQDMPEEAGEVTGVIGREFGVVFQERAITRMQYVGGAPVFQFDTVEENRGCLAPFSIVEYGPGAFFLAQDGFFYFDGVQSVPIGDNKVNRWFFDNFAEKERRRLSGGIDYVNQVVLWTVPYTSGVNASTILMYSYKDNRFSYAEQEVECFVSDTRQTIGLEDLDAYGNMDTIAVSLDSDQWLSEGRLRVAAFGSFSASGQLALFNGPTLEATLETGEFDLSPSMRGQIEELWPIVDNARGTVTAQIATRAGLAGDTLTWSAASNQNASGLCPVRAEGRFFRARVTIPRDADYTHAQGVNVHGVVTGRR